MAASNKPDNDISEQSVSQRRRRLLAGLSVSPILVSLASRPVLGAQNCAPSGFMSGNLSHPDANGSCGGYAPGYWKTHLNWPTPFVAGTCSGPSNAGSGVAGCQSNVNADGTKMTDVFQQPNFADRTMLQVLWECAGTLEYHIVAALLNAASNNLQNYVLTVDEVKTIYNSLRQNGYYLTTNNIRMFSSDIRTFIQNTYH